MRILFLDDNLVRHSRFKMNRIGCILVQAFTYEQAIKALDENPQFDEVYLDHDLSDAAAAGKPGPEERTGADVARYIAAMPKEKVPRLVYIHSFNFSGRTRMVQILGDAGIKAIVQPFTA